MTEPSSPKRHEWSAHGRDFWITGYPVEDELDCSVHTLGRMSLNELHHEALEEMFRLAARVEELEATLRDAEEHLFCECPEVAQPPCGPCTVLKSIAQLLEASR